MIIFVIFIFFKVPETKGKTFEEIAHQFAPGGHVEVEEMVDDDVFGTEGDLGSDGPDDGPDEDARLVTVNFRLGSHDEDDGTASPTNEEKTL